MDKKNIIGKVQKLLRLQNSAEQINSLGEAAAVARKIRILLMEHNLSMTDIDMEKENEIEIAMQQSEEWSGADGNGSTWKFELLSVIAENNLCKAFIRTNKRMFLVGSEENIAVVKEFYDYLLKAFRRMARDRWGDYVREIEQEYRFCFGMLESKRRESMKRMFMKSYFMGLPPGLKKNYDSMKPTSEETALVVCHERKIREFVDANYKWSEKSRRNRRTTVDRRAYHEGMADAENIGLNKQINK